MLRIIGFIVVGFAFLFIIVSLFVAKDASSGKVSAGKSSKAGWEYTTEKDHLTDHIDKFACLKSTNRVNFAFPYQGGNDGEFCFMNASGRLQASFQVSKGNIPCAITGCTLRFRFDDGAVQTHHAVGSRTYESNVVFLTNPSALMHSVTRAKRLRIASDFFQEGEQTFEFLPSGLEDGRLK